MARKISSNNPTPLDFDMFIPWICRQWQIPTIVEVTRMYQVEYIKENKRRSSSIRPKSARSIKFRHNGYESDTKKNIIELPRTPSTAVALKNSDKDVTVHLITYYDSLENLVEISVTGSRLFGIHRKIIQAINVCIPFHSFLNKLTISKGGVSYTLLYEISKLLPHSNLTEICLDNSYVPEGNYFVLLDYTSQLKCLSLNRCEISDVMCTEIATRIDFLGTVHSSLLVLQLGSNLITDIGAQHIGNILRRNRRLLHLNLSGNKISDVGVEVILKHLMEFKLTANERFESARRRTEYSKNKDRVFEICMEEAIRRQKTEELSTICSNKKVVSLKSNKSSSKSKKNLNFDEQSVTDLVEALAKEIMKEYEDPFDTVNIVKRDGSFFCFGNMVLCSLNLAYNELTYASVKLLETVIKYQSHILKSNQATGLMRVILDGNFIPKYCLEYERISVNLKNVVSDHVPLNTRKSTRLAGKK